MINTLIKLKGRLFDNFKTGIKDALISSPIMLDVRTDENWHIYFDLSDDPGGDSELAKLGLLYGQGISAQDLKNLRYIDLRPEDRAIICDNDICGK
jgi:hypothetical protein